MKPPHEIRWVTNVPLGAVEAYQSTIDVATFTGPPKATPKYTVAELKGRGMRGVYTTGAKKTPPSKGLTP